MTTIKENLTKLIELVTSEPAKMFDLAVYSTTTNCGTLHCTLGLAGTHKFFQDQGVVLVQKVASNGQGYDEMKVNGEEPTDENSLAHLNAMFGENAWIRLFAWRPDAELDDANPDNGGEWDMEILGGNRASTMTDKDLALARLNRQLEIYK